MGPGQLGRGHHASGAHNSRIWRELQSRASLDLLRHLCHSVRVSPLLFALWLGALDVQGDCTCPSPLQVAQHLTGLIDAGDVGGQASHVDLSPGEGFVGVRLLAPDGGLLAERRLEQSAPCDELAQAVAVVVAAWQAKLSPTLAVPAVDRAAPRPALPPSPEVVAEPSAKGTSGRSLGFDAGLGILTSIVGGEATVGAKLEATLFPIAIPLGLDLAVAATTTHAQSSTVAGIEARWTRPTLSIGPDLRVRGRTLMLDIHGDAVLALLHVQGSGLAQPSSDTGLQFGLAGGVRGLWAWNHGVLWLGVDLLEFPGEDRLSLGNQDGPVQVGQLPHLELQVAAGISLGRFR